MNIRTMKTLKFFGLALFFVTGLAGCKKDSTNNPIPEPEPDPREAYYGYWEIMSSHNKTVRDGEVVMEYPGQFDLNNKYYGYITPENKLSIQYVYVSMGVPYITNLEESFMPFSFTDTATIYRMEEDEGGNKTELKAEMKEDLLVLDAYTKQVFGGDTIEFLIANVYKKLSDDEFKARLFGYLPAPAVNNKSIEYIKWEREGNYFYTEKLDLENNIKTTGETTTGSYFPVNTPFTEDIQETITVNPEDSTATLKYIVDGTEDESKRIVYKVVFPNDADEINVPRLVRVEDLQNNNDKRYAEWNWQTLTTDQGEQVGASTLTEITWLGEIGDHANKSQRVSAFKKN